MKIVAISDTHCQNEKIKIPEGDILLHCGDALSRGTVEEFTKFLVWMDSLPFDDILYTPGNHDWFVYNNTSLAREMLKERGITLLVDEEVTVNGLRIYGTPWSPEFCGWAWMREDHEEESPDGEEGLEKYFKHIPEGLDILMSHSPPYGYLDYVPRQQHVGSKMLLQQILKVKPKLILTGHIHCAQNQGDGEGNDFIANDTDQIIHLANVSVLNEAYEVSRTPRIFNL